MIQRKQTLFLLVALTLTASLLFISLGQFAGANGIFELTFYRLMDVTKTAEPVQVEGLYFFPLAALIILASLLNLLCIFFFKNRPLQMRVCGINVGIQVGLGLLILYLQHSVAGYLEYDWTFHYSMILPILAGVIDYFAYRAISDDEALIRSLNRLR